MKLYYSLKPTDRLFPVTKHYLSHEMDRGCKAAGVKRIRIHDLRHSHVSLLIDMGFTALAIGDRVGHESEKITYRYYDKQILMTSCPGGYTVLLKYPPEQLSIINASIH